jgi:hypothetical protein
VRPADVVTVLVLAAGLTAPVAAHHSIASLFDRNKRMTMSAVVKQWRFVNPHPLIVVEAAAPGAPPRIWTLELDGRELASGQGFTKDTLKPGDRIEVTGDPSRQDPRLLFLRTLRRPSDGFRYDQFETVQRASRAFSERSRQVRPRNPSSQP